MAVSRHRHLDDVRRKLREVVPPRRRQTAGRGPLAVAPYGGSDARRVGERSVVDEINTAAASNPVPGAQSAPNGFVAKPRASSLCQGEHAVLVPQIVIQHILHVLMDAADASAVPPAVSAR
jgi:hypothetical protein